MDPDNPEDTQAILWGTILFIVLLVVWAVTFTKSMLELLTGFSAV